LGKVIAGKEETLARHVAAFQITLMFEALDKRHLMP
jgi:hypothetical protein